jgi:RNA polymerase sigma-70 factor (ECF subfamily)
VDYDANSLRRATTADDDAFDLLVEPHLPRCYRVACMITRDPDDASDVLQEALFRAYRYLGNLKPGRPFYPWFAKIVVNEALKLGKRSARRSTFIPLPEMEATETTEGIVLAREEQVQLWAAIQALPPDHRAVVVLRYYGDMSEQEMAEVLNVSPGTIKSRLHRARAALEDRLVMTDASGSKAVVHQFNHMPRGGAKNE